jgi:hypothetical protein
MFLGFLKEDVNDYIYCLTTYNGFVFAGTTFYMFKYDASTGEQASRLTGSYFLD